MNIQYDTELSRKCLEMWLNGTSRNDIACVLAISEGSVSNLVEQCLQNDSTLDTQRKIALLIRRAGIDIVQLASNVRFANAIKRQGASSEAITNFLSALQKQIDVSQITQDQAIRAITDCAEFSAKQNVPLTDLLKNIRDKYTELEGIKSEITKQNEELEASTIHTNYVLEKDRLTLEEVGDYRIMRRKMEHCGLSLSDSKVTINVMLNLKRMGYNLTRVIDVYSTTVSTEMRLRNMKEECHQLEQRLVAYRNRELTLVRNWGNQQRALQDYGLMTQMGLNMGHILAATAVFCKHMNHFTIDEILNEIYTYGNLRATNYRLAREIDGLIHQQEMPQYDKLV
jgi:hypothetical protein